MFRYLMSLPGLAPFIVRAANAAKAMTAARDALPADTDLTDLSVAECLGRVNPIHDYPKGGRYAAARYARR
jgi:hypothetical protein